MAESTSSEEQDEGGGGKKRLIIIIIVIALLVIVGGGAGAYFAGIFGGPKQEAAAEKPAEGDKKAEGEKPADGAKPAAGEKPAEGHAAAEGAAPAAGEPPPGSVVFFEMPEMVVNLAGSGKQPTFLKMKVKLELADQAAVLKIEQVLPRVVDSFQLYLRELRREDLEGSGGPWRLKEELLARVNVAVAPTQVRAVLLSDFLVGG